MKNALEVYRVEHKMTYQELATAAGNRSKGAVFLHCTGKRRVSPESAIAYELNLGIPRSELRPDLWPSPFSEDPLPKIN